MSTGVEFGVSQSMRERLGALRKLVHSLACRGRPIRVLEVGSYEGGSALMWSRAVGELCPDGGSVLCVDPWEPYLGDEDLNSNQVCRDMQNDLRSGAAFERFTNNIKHADLRAPISFMRGTLASCWNELRALPRFDLIYIDGSHAYEDVLSDLCRCVSSLIHLDGTICGDDLERQADEVPEKELRAHRQREYVEGYHPGVTAAVWKMFGRVECYHGAWWVENVPRALTHLVRDYVSGEWL